MKTSSYEAAIVLNNQGAIHVQYGRFLNAAQSFHSALDTIKSSLEEPIDEEATENDDNEVNSVAFEWSEDPRHHMKQRPQHDDDDSDNTFVYRRALVIRPALRTTVKPTDDGYVQESAAILFNLALAYHLYGLESKSRFLHTALRFYELAFGLRHSSSHPSKGTIIIHHLFDLALLNNLGQLHYAIFNFDKSLQCFVHLSEELSCRQQPMEQCDYMGFMLNLTLQAPTAAPQA